MLNYILEASIDDFIQSVERQNIALEVDASGARDGTDDPSFNGALIVSGSEKVRWSPVQKLHQVCQDNIALRYPGLQCKK